MVLTLDSSCSPKDSILVESEANISLSGLALAVLASLGAEVTCKFKGFHLGWIFKVNSLRENYLAF